MTGLCLPIAVVPNVQITDARLQRPEHPRGHPLIVKLRREFVQRYDKYMGGMREAGGVRRPDPVLILNHSPPATDWLARLGRAEQ
jgi:hypothetical protein